MTIKKPPTFLPEAFQFTLIILLNKNCPFKRLWYKHIRFQPLHLYQKDI